MEGLGVLLVRAGLRTAIIVAETSMTRKQITAARKRFGIKGSAESGPLPHAESLLSNRALTLEASLFMHSYLLIAQQPKSGVDIRAVLAAHSHYVDCHGSIRGGRVDLNSLLELDRAWVLARDFRSMVVGMRTCHTCHLGFVASINDRRQACPICSGVSITSSDEMSKSNLRSIHEYVEISKKVKTQANWGNSDEEIICDLQLRDDELEMCKELSKLSSLDLRKLVAAEYSTSEVFNFIRESSSLAAV
jgi:hypothetical protein